MKRFDLTVKGQVQGVNYRATTARKGRQLGLTGLVWNEPDGSVTVVAEGTERHLKTFLEWAKAGPPAATVEKHQVSWGKPTGQFSDFLVRD